MRRTRCLPNTQWIMKHRPRKRRSDQLDRQEAVELSQRGQRQRPGRKVLTISRVASKEVVANSKIQMMKELQISGELMELSEMKITMLLRLKRAKVKSIKADPNGGTT